MYLTIKHKEYKITLNWIASCNTDLKSAQALIAGYFVGMANNSSPSMKGNRTCWIRIWRSEFLPLNVKMRNEKWNMKGYMKKADYMKIIIARGEVYRDGVALAQESTATKTAISLGTFKSSLFSISIKMELLRWSHPASRLCAWKSRK